MAALLMFIAGCEKKEPPAKVEAPAVETPVIKNERPVMAFTLTDGSMVNARDIDEQMLLILFQPDCDHCQDEARQIKKRLEAFKDYQLYFISSQPIEMIEKFSRDYQLTNLPNVHFGHTEVQNVWNNFGSISAPSMYLYSKEGRLVESFEGLVDVEVIIKYL
ncbi:MAG TPA: redoxin domain-containing protein [Chryseosolibacter sp.]|nr:redoxin domain-containing protein [Chryseosolibacter sp.]